MVKSYNDESDKNIEFTSMWERYHAKGKGKNQKKNTCRGLLKKKKFSVELWKVIVGLIISYENYICPNSVKSFPDIPFKPKPFLSTPPLSIKSCSLLNKSLCSFPDKHSSTSVSWFLWLTVFNHNLSDAYYDKNGKKPLAFTIALFTIQFRNDWTSNF